MDFRCIGFDVRNWPSKQEIYADDTGCERNENVYNSLIKQFNLKENEYQLLEIYSQKLLDEVIEYINQNEYSNLVAIKFPRGVVEFNDWQRGYTTAQNKLDLFRFASRGLDVCDFNGFFTILVHPRIIEMIGYNGLIKRCGLMLALEVAQLANLLERPHSPFVVAEVLSLKSG
jgi:hypothetical protein